MSYETPKMGEYSESTDNAGSRDAFHVPCVLVSSYYDVEPGKSVMLLDSGKRVAPCSKEDRHGIVDPFLPHVVYAGRLFWVFIDPKFIGKLTHQFEISGIDSAPRVEDEDYEDNNSCRRC